MTDIIKDDAPILDSKKAIENLDGDSLFNDLVNNYDETLIKTLADLKKAMDEVDYKEIRMKSHSIKGPASYIQAERVRRAGEIIQQNIDSQLGANAYKNYTKLIVECVRLRREIRLYCCNRDSKIVLDNRSRQAVR